MKTKNIILLATLLIAVLFAFLLVLGANDSQNEISENQNTIIAHPFIQMFIPKSDERLNLSNKNSNAIDKLCGKTFEELTDWISKLKIKEKYIYVQNIHFINQSGQENRLHIAIQDRDDGTHREVKFFKLDVDGLPENIATPKDYIGLNPEQTINKIKAQFEILKELEEGEAITEDNLNIAYNKSSDQFTNIEISANNNGELNTVICLSGSSCRCIK